MLVVCLQIALSKSTTNLFTAVVVKNLSNTGFKIFSIISIVLLSKHSYIVSIKQESSPFMEDQEPSRVETIVKVCVLLWSATLLSLSYYEPPSGKKIVDFDPTFIASIFSASTASLGFQIKKKKDTIVDNKNSKVGIK